MGLESFKVVFDSPTSAYYAGQAVSGKIVLSLNKSKKVRALKVSFIGKAETRFQHEKTETQPNGESRNFMDDVTGEEMFFEYHYNILGGSGEVEISSGEHTYPFNASLPTTAPSSFEGENGFIRYKVRATLDRPWKFDEHAEGSFGVVTPLDLNFYEQAKAPVKKEENKYFCCLCCKSGPLTTVLSLPYTGFVSGGSLPFTIEVDNASNVEVTGVTVDLLKTITYKARGSQSAEISSNTSIVKVDFEAVGANNSKTWTHTLTVPQMPFHNLTTCSIIIINYVLKVVTVVSGAHLNLEMEVPMTFGSTPILAFPSAAASLHSESMKLSDEKICKKQGTK
ncbi:unnamed protein product [Bemisia tabaci]|uniref:Arrestin C-terminal-like domain-containing protein n=1 Tax=Bemisia tabaci TaxID=7038 RepID=A0A9N9ZYT8_BEMTA|nr:unnamed protein product [Bemisia tabaci]